MTALKWKQGAQDVPRFGLDQWHYAEPGNLTELERWPETEQGPACWRVHVAATTDGEDVHLTYASTEPHLSEDEAFDWAAEIRVEFLKEISP